MASGPSSEVTTFTNFLIRVSKLVCFFFFSFFFMQRKLFNRVPMFLMKSIDVPSRNEQWASLVVDSGTGVSASSPGQLRQLNTDTGLYVGK